ncbi:hypothetical protein ACHWQZ_G006542 [Mnemiopsis leidyi]
MIWACSYSAVDIILPPSDEWCSSFSYSDQDFKATFTADKLFLTSLKGSRENSEGTVNRGEADSSRYTGTLTFSDDDEYAFSYVFDVRSASFEWTQAGPAVISRNWTNPAREECPLPECNSFVYYGGETDGNYFTISFSTDKILLEGSVRAGGEGTLDRGSPGSLTYKGEFTFADVTERFNYVFYLRSSSIYWTPIGGTTVTNEWCSSFSYSDQDFKATFTADKLFLTSLKGSRENSEGTVNRGEAGSSRYTGTLTFSDDDEYAFSYVFDVRSASFEWTQAGPAVISRNWTNPAREECPLPECNSFVYYGGETDGNYFTITFSTDKILLEGSVRAGGEGTLDRGSPGSLTYKGEFTFADVTQRFNYVFYLRSSSIYWTPIGGTTVTSKWLNCIPIGCTFPDKWCSSFSYSDQDFKATFTADKLFLTSLKGSRENSEGTVNRGEAGSSRYTGTLTFSDDDEYAFSYVFDVRSASFEWTQVGSAVISRNWTNPAREECPLPEKQCSSFSSFTNDFDFTATFIAEKLITTSPKLGKSEGTVNRGNLGSSFYTGRIMFTHDSETWDYIFYLETRSFKWTKLVNGDKTEWSNGVPVKCLSVFPGAQCSSFVFGDSPFNVTFTTDKILLKSSTRADAEGTLDRGSPGSPTYKGEVTFTDKNQKYQYVFYIRSSSIYWTSDGETSVSGKWLNGIPIDCPLPEAWCSSFSHSIGDFKATFTADKVYMTSLRGTRDNSNGTVDRGSAGSTTYTGTITFSDIGHTFNYVFDVGSATFYWTQKNYAPPFPLSMEDWITQQPLSLTN